MRLVHGGVQYREYLREEQRSQRGCIAGRMQLEFHHGLLGPVRQTDAAVERKGREGRKETRTALHEGRRNTKATKHPCTGCLRVPSYASCLRDKPSAGQRASHDAACGITACDGYDADRARNDDAAADGELDVESGMDAPQLEKAAS